MEEAAKREKLLGYLDQPIRPNVENNSACVSKMPGAIIRKVAAAPPAPIYKGMLAVGVFLHFQLEPFSWKLILKLTSSILLFLGFNSTETKIQTPDGKVWKEEEFHNLSREIYRDLSQQFAGENTTQTSSHCYSSLVILYGQNFILLLF